MKRILLILLTAIAVNLNAQTYFPPTLGGTWETVDPGTLGWCTDKATDFDNWMTNNGSFACIILKDGRIAYEKYYSGVAQQTPINLNEASSVLTMTMVAKAIEEGKMNTQSPVTTYINGFSNATAAQEGQILFENLLSGTSGLDADLNYVGAPGDTWSSGLKLHDAIVRAIANQYGGDPNVAVVLQGIFASNPPNPGGNWREQNGVYNYSTDARGTARTALLLMANGIWDGQTILSEQSFLSAMRSNGGRPNKSYGYNFWLNGKSSYRLPEAPGTQVSGWLNPNGSDEAYSAIGAGGQFIDILPNQGIVAVRLGTDVFGNNAEVNLDLYREYWSELRKFACSVSATDNVVINEDAAFPNPFSEKITISGAQMPEYVKLYDAFGKLVLNEQNTFEVNTNALPKGLYVVEISRNNTREIKKMIKN